MPHDPRPAAEILANLQGSYWAWFDGPHPELEALCRGAVEKGLHPCVRLPEAPEPAAVAAWAKAGLETLALPATVDPDTAQALRQGPVRLAVHAVGWSDLPPQLAVAHALGVPLTFRAATPSQLTDPERASLSEAVRQAEQLGAAVHVEGYFSWPDGSETPARPIGRLERRLVSQGVCLDGTAHLEGTTEAEALVFAAMGQPVPDRPACWGGAGGSPPRTDACGSCTACPGPGQVEPLVPARWLGLEGPVGVVDFPWGDQLLTRLTMPALIRELAPAMVYAPVQTPELAPIALRPALRNPSVRRVFERLPSWARAVLGGRLVQAQRRPKAADPDRWRHQLRSWLHEQSFSDVRTLVVVGFESAAALLEHPNPPKRAVILDLHAMQGLDRLRGKSWPTGWRVVSAFPSYARLLARGGVPLSAVSWHPYPVAAPHVVSPTLGEPLFAGNHRRDWSTLAAACSQPRAVWTRLDVPAPLVSKGEAPLERLLWEAACAPWVAVPLQAPDRHPCGVSIAALALALGKPIVATSQPDMVYLLRDQRGAALVAPGDVQGWQAAMEELSDPVVLARRQDAARAARDRVSVASFVDTVRTGRSHLPAYRVGV